MSILREPTHFSTRAFGLPPPAGFKFERTYVRCYLVAVPSLPRSPIADWFETKFQKPTAPQEKAWPLIDAGQNVLIISPTGTGKTFAAFYVILNRLSAAAADGSLEPGIQAIYISPLRALNYDLEKNLLHPLREVYGSATPIEVGLRTGDTSPAERQRQFKHPPHILLTTPESLSLLLTQPRWLPALARVRWVVVDEIHALAENKRGSLLSIALERLADVCQKTRRTDTSATVPHLEYQRIGLSATVRSDRYQRGQAS
jgi:ATP-dependent helicase Lhr and Lhr-like helicase